MDACSDYANILYALRLPDGEGWKIGWEWMNDIWFYMALDF